MSSMLILAGFFGVASAAAAPDAGPHYVVTKSELLPGKKILEVRPVASSSSIVIAITVDEGAGDALVPYAVVAGHEPLRLGTFSKGAEVIESDTFAVADSQDVYVLRDKPLRLDKAFALPSGGNVARDDATDDARAFIPVAASCADASTGVCVWMDRNGHAHVHDGAGDRVVTSTEDSCTDTFGCTPTVSANGRLFAVRNRIIATKTLATVKKLGTSLCNDEPVRFVDDNHVEMTLGNATEGIGAPLCEAKPDRFVLGVSGGKRTIVYDDPWEPLVCGWRQKKLGVELSVAECTNANGIDFSTRDERDVLRDVRKGARAPPPPPQLPSALSLTATDVVVFGDGARALQFVRGKTNAPVTLEGASVVRLSKTGAQVQALPALDDLVAVEQDLDDDWHVVTAHDDRRFLIRLTPQ